MDFGEALRALKAGGKIARAGWNGKGMFIWLKPGNRLDEYPAPDLIAGVRSGLFEVGDDGSGTRLPCICMRAAGGETLEGWLASQTDVLAHDWMTVT